MDKNINQPPVMPKSKGNLVSQEDYNEWKQYERDLAAYKSAERPSEAPASSGHTPGPWTASFSEANDLWNIRGCNDQIFVAEVPAFDTHEATKANAELIARAPMMEKEFEVARNRVVELLDEKIALSKELQAHKDAIEQHITVLQESSLELDRIEREGKQLRKELQEARAALEKIKNLSKYKSDHDQILYDFKEINEVANAALSTNLKDR